MEHYKSLDGDLGIRSFEIRKGKIIVIFTSGEICEYTHESAGKHNVQAMCVLARTGKGLSTFVSEHVLNRHARKLVVHSTLHLHAV